MPFPEWHPPFSSFSSFSGVWGAKPLFSVGRMQIRHFRRFRQNGPLFDTGQKHGLPKTRFVPPRETVLCYGILKLFYLVQGCEKCFWKTMFLLPAKSRWLWWKWRFNILPTITRGFFSSGPGNGGCHPSKTPYFENNLLSNTPKLIIT